MEYFEIKNRDSYQYVSELRFDLWYQVQLLHCVHSIAFHFSYGFPAWFRATSTEALSRCLPSSFLPIQKNIFKKLHRTNHSVCIHCLFTEFDSIVNVFSLHIHSYNELKVHTIKFDFCSDKYKTLISQNWMRIQMCRFCGVQMGKINRQSNNIFIVWA